jgi:hypothetical protein
VKPRVQLVRGFLRAFVCAAGPVRALSAWPFAWPFMWPFALPFGAALVGFFARPLLWPAMAACVGVRVGLGDAKWHAGVDKPLGGM